MLGDLPPSLIWPFGGGVILASVIWLITRRLRPVVYFGLILAAWEIGPWWTAVSVALICGVVEVGVGLWGLADRAEKRLGKRE